MKPRRFGLYSVLQNLDLWNEGHVVGSGGAALLEGADGNLILGLAPGDQGVEQGSGTLYQILARIQELRQLDMVADPETRGGPEPQQLQGVLLLTKGADERHFAVRHLDILATVVHELGHVRGEEGGPVDGVHPGPLRLHLLVRIRRQLLLGGFTGPAEQVVCRHPDLHPAEVKLQPRGRLLDKGLFEDGVGEVVYTGDHPGPVVLRQTDYVGVEGLHLEGLVWLKNRYHVQKDIVRVEIGGFTPRLEKKC